MKFNLKRGFTLIELLVVIAIIGVLSAVVLASLNSARSKGNDAGVKANLATVGTQAALYLSDNANSYGTFPLDTCPTSSGA
ncbi:type II secretion system protein, partial [Candidatus Kaiserbacteria bacterium]|nr:type II secretion system protein [Candidatus Kaiserbacteria bacterium]